MKNGETVKRTVKSECSLRDIPLTKYAKQFNVSIAAISRIIRLQSRSKRIEKAIEDDLGKKIFPRDKK